MCTEKTHLSKTMGFGQMNYNRFFWKPQNTAAFREAQVRGNFWAPTGCEVTDGGTSVPTAGPASEETGVTPFKKIFSINLHRGLLSHLACWIYLADKSHQISQEW